MKATRRARSVSTQAAAIIGSVALLLACEHVAGPPGARGQLLEPNDADAAAGQVGGQDGRPQSMIDACNEAYTVGELPEPWFLADPPEQCLDSPIAHEPPQMYDDCTSNGVSPQGCGAQPTGVIYCQGNGLSWTSRTTQLCRVDADCPEGAACVVDGLPASMADWPYWSGQCEKRCTGNGGPGECIRCDMECDAAHGLCRARRAVAPVEYCEHSCQCSEPGAFCGQDGVCFGTLAVSAHEHCGEQGSCACNGGECVDGCCIMPDGSIAAGAHPACQP